MNTILQKRIEESSVIYEENLNEDYYCYLEIIEAYRGGAKFALQNQWISVEEALPPCTATSEQSIQVIARTNKGVVRCAYYHIYLKQWFSAETSKRIDNVTKWMFVPEKGGEE